MRSGPARAGAALRPGPLLLALLLAPACGAGPEGASDADGPAAAALPRARVQVGMHVIEAEVAETL
ncbi:MAG: hypothetical protein R3263_01015, partial [Myxococcota bacterium]|nr:hypothetical protein [Myxococcota bacterium]